MGKRRTRKRLLSEKSRESSGPATPQSKRVRAQHAPVEKESQKNDEELFYSSQVPLERLQEEEKNSQQVESDDESGVPDADIVFHSSQVHRALIEDQEELEGLDSTMEEQVGQIMRYVLFTNTNKQKCTTAKIKEVALGGEVRSKPHLIKLMAAAQAGLKDLFGYELVSDAFVSAIEKGGMPVKGKSAKKKKKEDKEKKQDIVITGQDCWFLVNNTSSDKEKMRIGLKRNDNGKRGILMALLSLILMKDCAMSEKDMFACLRELGIERKTSGNSLRASGNDLVRDFLSEAYLKRMKSNEETVDGSVSWLYTLGTKTYIEIGVMNLVKFMEQTTGVTLGKRDKARLVGLQVTTKTRD